jgi:hypothetical protein
MWEGRDCLGRHLRANDRKLSFWRAHSDAVSSIQDVKYTFNFQPSTQEEDMIPDRKEILRGGGIKAGRYSRP